MQKRVASQKSYNLSYFTRPRGSCFLLAARQSEQVHSALTPQRRLRLLAVRETAAYSAYVRIFTSRQTPKEPKPRLKKSYNLSYFEAARCSRIRSLLCVNEEFENKADAKRAKLDGFYLNSLNSIATPSSSTKAKSICPISNGPKSSFASLIASSILGTEYAM